MDTDSAAANGTGPLQDLKVIEMAGLGPVPFAGLMLAELGADVLRIERADGAVSFLPADPEFDMSRHGRANLKIDLKRPEGRALARELAAGADVLIEGFRPGVMERLGLGPQDCHDVNPALVYGRMTGFGQTGPLAGRAGHDLTYLALSGVLHAIGPQDGKPLPPLNLVADYGGGAMFLLTGILAALLEREKSGRGQVIDAAMIEGASMLSATFFGFLAAGFWKERRGSNLLDSGAPFYDTYETADRRHVAVACLEPKFFAEFARLLPLPERFASRQYDRTLWPELRRAITARFASRTRDEWALHFEESDACVAPVLTWTEASAHPHNVARKAHLRRGRLLRPAPSPRFSRTQAAASGVTISELDEIRPLLSRFGIGESRYRELIRGGVLAD